MLSLVSHLWLLARCKSPVTFTFDLKLVTYDLLLLFMVPVVVGQ